MKRIFENRDCMEGMEKHRDLLTSRRTLAILDPPYGIGNFVQTTGNVNYKYKDQGQSLGVEWNSAIPSRDYFEAVVSVTRDQIIWGANYYNCFSESGGAIIWNKLSPNPKFSQAEIASVSWLKRVAVYTQEWYGFRTDGDHRIHPCQKPVALYRWLLKNYAKPGDLILDTHVGSASSLIACEMEGFDYVGFELDPEYYAAAQKRLQQFRAQTTIFDHLEAQ